MVLYKHLPSQSAVEIPTLATQVKKGAFELRVIDLLSPSGKEEDEGAIVAVCL